VNLSVIPIIALLLYLAGCASPELTRTRGGGPGADIGNRDKFVHIHDGAMPFEKPPKIKATQHPSVDPANQADQLARR
jgi:hypothetical protein